MESRFESGWAHKTFKGYEMTDYFYLSNSQGVLCSYPEKLAYQSKCFTTTNLSVIRNELSFSFLTLRQAVGSINDMLRTTNYTNIPTRIVKIKNNKLVDVYEYFENNELLKIEYICSCIKLLIPLPFIHYVEFDGLFQKITKLSNCDYICVPKFTILQMKFFLKNQIYEYFKMIDSDIHFKPLSLEEAVLAKLQSDCVVLNMKYWNDFSNLPVLYDVPYDSNDRNELSV